MSDYVCAEIFNPEVSLGAPRSGEGILLSASSYIPWRDGTGTNVASFSASELASGVQLLEREVNIEVGKCVFLIRSKSS